MGLDNKATKKQVMRAFKPRMRVCHPDRNRGKGGDVMERMAKLAVRLNIAKLTLCDPDLRRHYEDGHDMRYPVSQRLR